MGKLGRKKKQQNDLTGNLNHLTDLIREGLAYVGDEIAPCGQLVRKTTGDSNTSRKDPIIPSLAYGPESMPC